MNAFIGEIKLFAINFAPDGWLLCNGQTYQFAQYQALGSILGTIYGGNPGSTFQVPNLQGSVVVGTGQGIGLSSYYLGQHGGVEGITINQQTMPYHNHTFNTGTGAPTTRVAIPTASTYLTNYATSPSGTPALAPGYAPVNTGSTTPLNPNAVGTSLGNGSNPTIAHENRMPYLAMNYYICATDGEYPQRP